MKAYTIHILLAISFLSFHPVGAMSQEDRLDDIERELMMMAQRHQELNNTVDISVTGVSIQEFLRGIAVANKVNISVSPELQYSIVNNFSNVKVVDVLVFLVRKYKLDVEIIGSIISISAYEPEPEPEKAYTPKEIKVEYDEPADLLSMDLSNDSLDRVAKAISEKTGKNLILASGLADKTVSIYIQNAPYENALDKLALTNNLQLEKTEDNFYVLNPIPDGQAQGKTNQKHGGNKSGGQELPALTEAELKVDGTGRISMTTDKLPLVDIFKAVSSELGKDFFLISELSGEKTINIHELSYDDFLSYLLDGTAYTFKNEGGIYLVGERKVLELREFSIIHLQFRTVEKIIEVIPADLQNDLEIKEFPELNSLIVSGNAMQIEQLKDFIRNVDKLVPVVMIEIMILDYQKSYNISTGVEAGISDEAPTKTEGNVFPYLDVTLSTQSINELINTFNGFGTVKLGKVSSSFYLNLKAMEDQGIIKIRSTPKLSTLNGHEATMSIGKTEYYLEEQQNVYGTQNPQLSKTQTYKSVNADLTISIKPIVSGDDQITLEIDVQQSDFTERISKYAPPGSVTRNFNAMIRVKNEEMILLGGLEENRSSETGQGIPWFSRIPVLKWFFSSMSRTSSKNRLNIFIKPVIIN